MTHILVFLHSDSEEKGQVFLDWIQKKLVNIEINICHNVLSLSEKLKQTRPFIEKEIVLLFLDSKNRLEEILAEKENLADKKIVIVYSETLHEQISLIHKFYPRYFTAANDQYDDLCDILNRMIVL